LLIFDEVTDKTKLAPFLWLTVYNGLPYYIGGHNNVAMQVWRTDVMNFAVARLHDIFTRLRDIYLYIHQFGKLSHLLSCPFEVQRMHGIYCIFRESKCIVVTRVCVSFCVSVCLSVRGRMPTLLYGPGCNLAEW